MSEMKKKTDGWMDEDHLGLLSDDTTPHHLNISRFVSNLPLSESELMF